MGAIREGRCLVKVYKSSKEVLRERKDYLFVFVGFGSINGRVILGEGTLAWELRQGSFTLTVFSENYIITVIST